MTVADNPAGRLFEILKQFQKSSDNTLLVTVIASTFNVDAKDTAQVLEIYLELLLLVRQAKNDVLKISGINQNLYLEPFNSLETAFSQNSLHHNWSNFKQHVGPSVMKGLEFCADTMSAKVGEKAIEQEEIDNLQKEVNDLLDSVLKSEINHDLKKFLIEQLEQIRHTLIYYRINGGRGLKEAFGNIVGSTFVFSTNYKDVEDKKDEKSHKIKARFLAVMSNLAKMVAFANDMKGLTGVDFPSLPGI